MALCLLSVLLEQGIVVAQLGLCSAFIGDNPPKTYPGRDGATGLIVVDQTHGRLPAGTLASWTVDNPGGAAPILMQAWRAVGSRTFQLVCETKANLKAGVQTIIADPPCEVQDGDTYGWRQDGISPAQTGGIGADTMHCDPSCTKAGCNDCEVCNNAYNGVVWNHWVVPPATFPPIAIGGTFEVSGCGQRLYSISVAVEGQCLACAWGCHLLASLVLALGSYVGVRMAVLSRLSPPSKGANWRQLLPHQQQVLPPFNTYIPCTGVPYVVFEHIFRTHLTFMVPNE